MSTLQSTTLVRQINQHLSQHPWFDFEVMTYRGYSLTVMGGLDASVGHQLEIHFDRVFFVSLPFEWRSDTSRDVLRIMEGPSAVAMNRRFRVEHGYELFAFRAEDYPDNFDCVVAAESVRFDVRIGKVLV